MFVLLPYSAYQWLKAFLIRIYWTNRDIEVTTKIFDRNGTLLYEIYGNQK